MRLGVKTLRQLRYKSRFADTGFAGDKNDLAVTGLGARPAAQEQLDLLVAPDERAQRRAAQCFESADDSACTQHLCSRHRRSDALDLDGAEVAVLEKITDQPPRGWGDDHCFGLGQG